MLVYPFLAYDKLCIDRYSPVRFFYNPSFSACFFSQNSVFLSQQISRNSVSACFFSDANEAIFFCCTTARHIRSFHLVLLGGTTLIRSIRIYVHIWKAVASVSGPEEIIPYSPMWWIVLLDKLLKYCRVTNIVTHNLHCISFIIMFFLFGQSTEK